MLHCSAEGMGEKMDDFASSKRCTGMMKSLVHPAGHIQNQHSATKLA
jgi:hypothetical protein